ncbi:hypothetical protein ASZ78_010394 [Callipepla squamata]|uniref:CCHC-type domain-containing protein n=1 Tax=Callipepla squamata TaxID=9009 RepID=A0A226NB91_CALSU|nr:hypothetical protein ASZ78_010394 [Callipepla squamata]
MGDTAKPSITKQSKEPEKLFEDEIKGGLLWKDYQVVDEYGKVHSNKIDISLQKKRGTPGHYGGSPRRGPRSVFSSPNSLKNTAHSQGPKLNDTQKDQIKKWISDDHRGASDSRRDYRSGVWIPTHNRSRKDSFHEIEVAGDRNVRRQLQKDLADEDMPDMQRGSSGNQDVCYFTYLSGSFLYMLLKKMKKLRKTRRSRRSRKDEYDQDDEVDGPVIDESVLSAKELLGLQQAEERLKRDFIYRLKKQPRTYPSAKYACKLCDVLIESVAFAHKHIKEKRHKKSMKEKQEEQMLSALPPPAPSQIKAISVAIENIVQEFGLSNADLQERLKIRTIMEDLLRQKLPESFIGVDADFHTRIPVVVCREKQSGLICKVSAGNENAYLTTNHLATIGKLEPTVASLVIAFRYWAKIEGFSLNKLTNFHLKEIENDAVVWEHSPVEDADLPQESSPKRDKVPLVFDSVQKCSAPVGQLWVELLRFYALEFNMADLVISIRLKEIVSRELKDWPKKRIAVEDPYSVKRNVARTLNSQLMYEYILHCLRATYKYFALPHKKTVKLRKQSHTNADEEKSQKLDDGNDTVKHESSELQNTVEDYVIETTDIPQVHGTFPSKECDGSESVTEEELADDTSHLGVAHEDSDCIIEEVISGNNEGFKPSCEEMESGNEEEEEQEEETRWNNVLSTEQGIDEDSDGGDLPVTMTDHDIETCSTSDLEGFQNTALTESDEFGLECTGIIANKTDVDEESTEGTDELDDSPQKYILSTQNQLPEVINSEEEEEEEELSLLNQAACSDILRAKGELDSTFPGSGDENALSEEDDDLSITNKYEEKCFKDNVHESLGMNFSQEDLSEKGGLSEDNTAIEKCLESELFYEFSKQAFTKGKSPTVVCSLCKREGHLKRDCPEDFKKIELDPLPPLTPKFSVILDQVCVQCYQDFAPNIVEDQAREHIRQNLENFIRLEFPGLRNVLPITTAKVPIVKFFHVRSGLEVDISLYNTLALHNTRLLSSYAAIDCRVKYLCYTMKVFTKMCDIGDASRGSLSSYAYTLMVLYFLQQRNPPVIPVLQEIYKEPKKPEILVDGWNVYFFDKIEELPVVWPDCGKNTESVGQLWLGLLRFYTEEFDFKEHVICIRRKSLLTTFKKQWTSKYIVIEDPFDLNHNLGAGLSRKMTNFIMKAFINGRRVFGTPVKIFPKEYPTKMEYFFDPEVLTEGELAPNDRCCRICGKIGHFMKDCPMRRKLRRRRDYEDGKNQRYTENKEKSKEDKEVQNRTTEKEGSVKEGKLHLFTPQKSKVARGIVETGKEKSPRQSAERWKRPEDRELKEKRCFICGREGHIKKECPQYKVAAGGSKPEALCGSPLPPAAKHAGRLNQGRHVEHFLVRLPQNNYLEFHMIS